MKEKFKHTPNPTFKQAVLFGLLFLILVSFLLFGVFYQKTQQFSLLAQSFDHLKLYFLKSIGGLGQDPVFYNHHIYWSEGPFPAILLMPFVAITKVVFGAFFFQGYLSWLLSLGVILFVYKISRRLGFNGEDSLLLGLVFAIGSVFIGVSTVTSSWYFAQVIATFLLFWGLYEYFCRAPRRWWLLGIISALILLTRVPAAAIVIFLLLELFRVSHNRKQQLKFLAQLLVPVVVAGFILLFYNFLRFHNPFQTGFKYELLSSMATKSRALGTISPIHIPANLYSLLLRPPLPILRNPSSWTLKFPFITNNPYGISIFITSPYLLYLFIVGWRKYSRTLRNLLLSAIVSLLAVTSYFGIGVNQYGYRYSLDFLPALFVIFLALYRNHHDKLSLGMKLLLIGSIILNSYLMLVTIYY